MPTIAGKRTCLCYLDEAGDLYFGETGTRYFLCTALVVEGEGFPLHRALLECRYEVISQLGRFSNSHEGNDYFHATEDSLDVRAKVFPVLASHTNDARVYSLVTEKRTLPEELQSSPKMFEVSVRTLLNGILSDQRVALRYDHICVMMDIIPVHKNRKAILMSLKQVLKALLAESGVTFSIMPMASKSDLCLQAVDYYSWALYRAHEKDDPTSLQMIKENIIPVPAIQ